ncbi:unnamed protein product [Rotaria sp. Silwood2]|nr:unnamed protein product [Rotaria sp. Silwood2]
MINSFWTNTVLSSKNGLPPHVLFALDNVIRRVAEYLVGLIRPDFISAATSIAPITPSDAPTFRSTGSRSPFFPNPTDAANEEIARLHQQYAQLLQTSRNHLSQLISIENNNVVKLYELSVNQEEKKSSSKAIGLFLPVESSPTIETTDSEHVTTSVAEEQNKSSILTQKTKASQQITQSRSLIEIEQEHDQLLKSMIENRTRLNQLLRSSST